MNYNTIIKVLEISERRYGKDFPLTVSHLINLLKLAENHEIQDAEIIENHHKQLMNECLDSNQ